MSDHWDSQWRKNREKISTLGGVPRDFRRTELVANIEPTGSGPERLERCCDLAGVDELLRCDTLVGDPSPTYKFWRRGQWVTQLSLRHAYFAQTIVSFLNGERGALTILEIGAGYGGLSATLVRALNVTTYVFVDAEPCLELQRKFTSEALDPDMTRTVFLTPGSEWKEVPDLIVNTHSFAEMDHVDVERYFAQIQDILPEEGALFSVNLLRWRVSSFHEYPFDEFWRHEVLRLSRCDSRYVESLSVRDYSARSPHPRLFFRDEVCYGRRFSNREYSRDRQRPRAMERCAGRPNTS